MLRRRAGLGVAADRRAFGEIFAVLANPVRHLELDGSGMLRGAVTRTR
jgi:hypothetical protein